MAGDFLLPLVQKMADVLLIIALRQFWSRGGFFGMQALPKNRGHMLTTKIGTAVQTGLTGMHRLVRPVKVTLSKYKFDYTIA